MAQPGGGGGGAVPVEGAARPAAAMVALQLLFSVLQIFIKLALNDGMDARVLVAYRLMFATAFLCPIAFLIERKKRPPLTMKVILQLFLCGLFGFSINQNLYVFAIKLTSATFVTAISNLTPATTFILAILTRLETLNLRKPAGLAKLLGTLVGMGGAMLLAFYKGSEVKILGWLPRPSLAHIAEDHCSRPPSSRNQMLGSLLGITSCFTYAAWLVIQAKVGEVYPCHYSIAAMVCLFRCASVHCNGALRPQGHGALEGLIASGCAFPLLSWCLRKKGPVFVAVFSPLMLIFVAALSSVLLQEALHLGSVIGAVLIVAGLYLVLWGKAREAADARQDEELGKEPVPAAAAGAGENEIESRRAGELGSVSPSS